MIVELIKNYGDIGALGVFVLLMVWYVRFTTKRQAEREDKHDEERIEKEKKRDEERKEETLFIRNLVTNDMKELHNNSAKNTELNNRSITMLKDISVTQKEVCGLIKDLNGKINGQK